MQMLTIILTLYFSVLLGISGAEKIGDTGAFNRVLRRQQILPQWTTLWVSRLLPWSEVLVASLLLIGVAATWMAAFVLALCICFTVVKAMLFIKKSDVSCGCIGLASNERVDGPSVLVSILMVSAAGVLAWTSYYFPWPFSTARLLVAVAGIALLSGATGVAMLRQVVRIYTAPDVPGLGLGEQAPSVSAVDLQGQIYTLGDQRGWVIVAFLLPGCPACPETLRVLNEWIKRSSTTERAAIDIVVMGVPDLEANTSLTHELDYDQGGGVEQELRMLTPPTDVGSQLFHVGVYPTVFVLDPHNVVRARGRVNYSAHLESLLQQAFASVSPPLSSGSARTTAVLKDVHVAPVAHTASVVRDID